MSRLFLYKFISHIIIYVNSFYMSVSMFICCLHNQRIFILIPHKKDEDFSKACISNNRQDEGYACFNTCHPYFSIWGWIFCESTSLYHSQGWRISKFQYSSSWFFDLRMNYSQKRDSLFLAGMQYMYWRQAQKEMRQSCRISQSCIHLR